MSLAKQLSQIQNPEFTALTGTGRKALRQRASYLYDAGYAATIEMDQVYEMGVEGYNELKQMDLRLENYEQMLFSEQALETDRVLQGSGFQKALDQAINGFLQRISTFFLLNPTGKVLEWLVRRFRVNEFNVDSLIQMALPYYETKNFTSLLLILDLRNPKWEFLKRITEGKQMDRLFLLRRLYSDTSLLGFIGDFVYDSIQNQNDHQTLFTFYTSTFLHYLSSVNNVDEKAVLYIMRFIAQGICSLNNEWRLSNYLVLSQLCTRVSLSPHVLEKIVSDIVGNFDSKQTILILLSIFKSQEYFPGKNKDYCKKLVELIKMNEFESNYQTLAKKDFTKVLFETAMHFEANEQLEVLVSFLDQEMVYRLTENLFYKADKIDCNFFAKIQNLYPNTFDDCLGDFLSKSTLESKKMIEQCLCSTALSHRVVDTLLLPVSRALLSNDAKKGVDAIRYVSKQNEPNQDWERVSKTIVAALRAHDVLIEEIIMHPNLMVEITNHCFDDLVDALVSFVQKQKPLNLESFCTAFENLNNLKQSKKLFNAMIWIKILLNQLEFPSEVLKDVLITKRYALDALNCVNSENFEDLKNVVLAMISDDDELWYTAAEKAINFNKQDVLKKLFLFEKHTKQVMEIIQKNIRFLNMEFLCQLLSLESSACKFRSLKFMEILIRREIKNNSYFDYQTLIIYIVPCFLDERKEVRQKTKTVIQLFHQVLEKATQVFEPNQINIDAASLSSFYELILSQDYVTHETILHTKFKKSSLEVIFNLLNYIPVLNPNIIQKWLLIIRNLQNSTCFEMLHLFFKQIHLELNQDKVPLLESFLSLLSEKVASRVFVREPLDTYKQFLTLHNDENYERVQLKALQIMESSLWSFITMAQQYEILCIFLNIVAKSQSTCVVSEAKRVLRRIPLTSDLVAEFFIRFLSQNKQSRKRVKTETPIEFKRMRKLASILELCSYKHFENSFRLIRPLFDTLEFILDTKTNLQYDYIIQLILTTIQSIDKSRTDESYYRIDLLVTCIRSTENPQTHNSVLTLLSSLAELCPDRVLLNLMPIFTFMGTHVLKQDDEYTFHVIESTISQIVPHLLSKIDIQNIVQVFVDAVLYIPCHRRLRLFSTLCKSLQMQNIHIVILLLLEKNQSLLEFSLLLMNQINYQLSFLTDLMNLYNNALISEMKTEAEAIVLKIPQLILVFIEQLMDQNKEAFCLESLQNVELFVLETIKFSMNQIGSLDLLHSIPKVLGPELFLTVIRNLFKNDVIATKCISLFVSEFESWNKNEIDLFSNEVSQICFEIHDLVNNDEERIKLCITAIQLIVLKLNNPIFINKSVPLLLSLLESTDSVSAAAYQCLSCFFSMFKERMVSNFNIVMKKSIVFYKSCSTDSKSSVISLWESLTLNLSVFITPFLPQLLSILINSDFELMLKMSQKIEPRSLVPAIIKFIHQQKLNEQEISKICSIADKLFLQMSKKDVSFFHSSILRDFYLHLMNPNNLNVNSNYSHSSVLGNLGKFVLLLSDDQFRPWFLTLKNWSNGNLFGFFRIMSVLFSSLKHIMVDYFAECFDLFIDSLKLRETSQFSLPVIQKACSFENSHELMCLNLNELTQALCSQLPESTECLIKLCKCVKEEIHWKKINFVLLQNIQQQVNQKECLKAIGFLFERMGDCYLPILPETVPTLAECLEDPTLEQTMAIVISQIESVLGEPLLKYLKK